MKLILFAFAAIAFSGSSKAKEDADKTPSEPEKPVSQTEPHPEPQPVPQPVVPIPEPAVELSAEEKRFGVLTINVVAITEDLLPLKAEVETAETKLANAQSTVKQATEAVQSALAELRRVEAMNSDKSKPRETELKVEIQTKRKLEDQALKKKQDSEKRVTKAKAAYNAMHDKMVAENDTLGLEAAPLLRKANANAESAKEDVKTAEKQLTASKDALKKVKKISDYYHEDPQAFPKFMEDTDRKVAEERVNVTDRKEALKAAETKAKEASTIAKRFDTSSKSFVEFYNLVCNQHTKY